MTVTYCLPLYEDKLFGNLEELFIKKVNLQRNINSSQVNDCVARLAGFVFIFHPLPKFKTFSCAQNRNPESVTVILILKNCSSF